MREARTCIIFMPPCWEKRGSRVNWCDEWKPILREARTSITYNPCCTRIFRNEVLINVYLLFWPAVFKTRAAASIEFGHTVITTGSVAKPMGFGHTVLTTGPVANLGW